MSEIAGISSVIFDMDGVLSHLDRARRCEAFAAISGLTPAEVQERIWESGFDERADEGAFTADEYLEEFGRRLGGPISLDQWIVARRAGMTLDREVLPLVEVVSRRATVAMLTNNGPLLRAHLGRIAPEVSALFGERAFVSCQFGTGKDHPEVFGLVLSAIGGTPEGALFIDDSPSYVANARAAGLHGYDYEGIEGLRVELRRLGLVE